MYLNMFVFFSADLIYWRTSLEEYNYLNNDHFCNKYVKMNTLKLHFSCLQSSMGVFVMFKNYHIS